MDFRALAADFPDDQPLPVVARSRKRRRADVGSVSLSGGQTVESVARSIGTDEATLWEQANQVMIEKTREKFRFDESVMQEMVHRFVSTCVPRETYDPHNLCGSVCFYGGGNEPDPERPSWMVGFCPQYSLFGCRVHGTVHRCGIGQCYATRVDRDTHRFCLYSGAFLGFELDMHASEFRSHSAHFSVTRPATYINGAVDDIERVLKNGRDRSRTEDTGQTLLTGSSEPVQKVRRRVHRRAPPRRTLSNVAQMCYKLVEPFFYNTEIRNRVVDRMLESAKGEADKALAAYHASRVVRIQGREAGVVLLSEPFTVLSILVWSLRRLDNLFPTYPWPGKPFVTIDPAVERNDEAEAEVESVCMMVEAFWNAFQEKSYVTTSALSFTNLACYLVFCLGNSRGVMWEDEVLFPSSSFLFTKAPSNEWSIHVGAFSTPDTPIVVSQITDGRREYTSAMQKMQKDGPFGLIDLKINLRRIYDMGEEEDAEVEALDGQGLKDAAAVSGAGGAAGMEHPC